MDAENIDAVCGMRRVNYFSIEWYFKLVGLLKLTEHSSGFQQMAYDQNKTFQLQDKPFVFIAMSMWLVFALKTLQMKMVYR